MLHSDILSEIWHKRQPHVTNISTYLYSDIVRLMLTSAVPEDGDNEFARNVGLHVPYYKMASYIIRPEHGSSSPGNLKLLVGLIVVHEDSLLLGCYTVPTVNSCEVSGLRFSQQLECDILSVG